MPILETKNLVKRFDGVYAVDVSIDEGEIVALMGPNGVGKSTILKTIFGLTPAHSGKVLWHGQSFDPIPYTVVENTAQKLSESGVLEKIFMGKL